MVKLSRSKIYLAISLVFAVVLIGVLGYRYISNYTWVDALYMTIITMATVGFKEVQPLDDTAKIFTVFLILASVFILGFAIAVLSEYLLGRNSLQLLKKRLVKNKIKSLTNHVVVCGFGRNGRQAAEKLKAYNKPFVVIEKDIEVVSKYENEILFIEGDASEDEILFEAGIEKAEYLISAMADDASNLFVVLSARQLNQKLSIISRASLASSQNKLLLAGANKVIMPDKIGGDHMASLVVMPDLITFINKLSLEGEHTTNLEEVAIEALEGYEHCNSIRDLDLRQKTGCTIIGYITPDGQYIINPEADIEIQPKSKVIVLGRPEQIKKLNEMFHLV